MTAPTPTPASPRTALGRLLRGLHRPSALLLLLCAFCARADAERSLSLAEAIALARAQRTDAMQRDIDYRRAKLQVLRTQLDRVRLLVSAQVTEQFQAQNRQLTGGDAIEQALCIANPVACGREAHPFTAIASLTIPIWTGLSLEANASRARLLRSAAESDLQSIDQSIGLEVAQAYFAVRRADLRTAIEQATLLGFEAIEKIVRTRSASGQAPPVDANRALVAVIRQRVQLRQIEAQTEAARALLAQALQIHESVRLADDPIPPVAIVSLDEALLVAHRQRPDMKAAAARAAADQQATRAAKGAYWPQLSAVATTTLRNPRTVLMGQNQEALMIDFIAGAQLKWTVFDMLTTRNNVRDAEYTAERSALDKTQIEYQVEADVRTTHARLRALSDVRDEVLKTAQLARENTELLRRRYQAGAALIFELLDSQQQLAQTARDALDNTVDLVLGELALRTAMAKL